MSDFNFFQDTILAATLEVVEMINDYVLCLILQMDMNMVFFPLLVDYCW